MDRFFSFFHKKIGRKEFLKNSLKLTAGLCASYCAYEAICRNKVFALINEKRGIREASFYERIGDDAVQCLLCPNKCTLQNGQRSFCRVREPIGGKLCTLVYALITAMHIDPIEKKPFFHFLPGTRSFSIATAGCNSRCKYCQNWTISQKTPEETDNVLLSCDNLIRNTLGANCETIAYTYSEPAIFYEYMFDSSVLAHKYNIRNLMVTGGKINPEPIKKLKGVVDGANINLKGFDKQYLRDVCAQDLDDILRTITLMKETGIWIEITNLIVPTLNDNFDQIRQMSRWIYNNVGADVPLHFSRFWPLYKLRSLYPTPSDTLIKAREIALSEKLNYVYIGNVAELEGEDTICPSCGKKVLVRKGLSILENNVSHDGKCNFCKGRIAGVWS